MKDEFISGVLNLLLSSKSHVNYPLWAVDMNILQSIRVGSYRAYLDGGVVIGFINWTFLSMDEIQSVIVAGGMIDKSLWRASQTPGTSLFIPELMANDNLYSSIHFDIQSLFPECPVAYGLSWRTVNSQIIPRLRKLKRISKSRVSGRSLLTV